MNVLKMIRQLAVLKWKDFLITIAIILAGSLVGFGFGFLVGNLTESGTYINFASMLASVATYAVLIFGVTLTGNKDFTTAVSFSRARKTYLPARYITYVVEFFIVFCILKLIVVLDLYVGSHFFAEQECFDMFDYTMLQGVGLSVVLPCIVLLVSIIYTVFEMKFFWILWAIWMFGCLGVPRIHSAMTANPDSFPAKIGFFFQNALNGDTVYMIILLAIVTVIAAIANVIMYRKVNITL